MYDRDSDCSPRLMGRAGLHYIVSRKLFFGPPAAAMRFCREANAIQASSLPLMQSSHSKVWRVSSSHRSSASRRPDSSVGLTDIGRGFGREQDLFDPQRMVFNIASAISLPLCSNKTPSCSLLSKSIRYQRSCRHQEPDEGGNLSGVRQELSYIPNPSLSGD